MFLACNQLIQWFKFVCKNYLEVHMTMPTIPDAIHIIQQYGEVTNKPFQLDEARMENMQRLLHNFKLLKEPNPTSSSEYQSSYSTYISALKNRWTLEKEINFLKIYEGSLAWYESAGLAINNFLGVYASEHLITCLIAGITLLCVLLLLAIFAVIVYYIVCVLMITYLVYDYFYLSPVEQNINFLNVYSACRDINLGREEEKTQEI